MNFKKKFVSFLFISATVIVSSASLTMANTLGSVNGNNVNVRTESNTGSDVLTKYSAGQAVNVIGYENNFFKVDIDGAGLYIAVDFIDILKANGTIDGDNVNVRSSASMDSAVLGKLNNSDEVVVVGCSDGWLKIEYNDSVAYVNEDFVKGEFVGYISGNMDSFSVTASVMSEPVASEVVIPAEAVTSEAVVPEATEPESAASAEETTAKNVVEPKVANTEALYGVISSSTGLRLRSEADIESKVLTLIPSGVALDILSQTQGWLKVNFAGYEGYISDEFVTLNYGTKPESNANEIGQQVIDYGKRFLGTPYKWAGNDLSKGVDCSGFVYNVYKHFGVNLNRNSAAMASNGYAVSKSDLQVGDLVLFDTSGPNNGGISHVGIYMGDGKFIHSSSSTRTWGVVISSLSEEYYIKAYVSARRVL